MPTFRYSYARTFIKVSFLGLLVWFGVSFLITSAWEPPTAYAATFNIANGDITALKAALTSPNPPHIINLATAGTYTLTSVDNTTTFGATGLPIIDRAITINGNGATLSRASGGATPLFRLFYIVSTGNLTLNNLTLTNGNDNSAYGGGAIFNQGGILTLNATTFANNTAILGGGAIANVAQGGAGTVGGTGPSVTANLSVTNSTFTANTTTGFGGGAIYNAAKGGDTGATGTPGGSGSATTSVTKSTFASNQANSNSLGGAIFNGAENGGGLQGGAGSVALTVANSTFWANQASGAGGALVNLNLGSAGSSNVSASLTLTHVTLANNTSLNSTGGGVTNGTLAGALPATTTLRNTLLVSNSGGNCFSAGATFATGIANLEYTGSSGVASCGSGSTLTTTNPLAGGLANNGGPTQTVALATAPNAALDSADLASCTSAPVNSVDQRGLNRPSGAGCDIGAFEAQVGCAVTSVVSSRLDDGSCGTLRTVLAGTASGTITFNLTTPVTISLNSGLVIPAGVSIQGVCSGGVPQIILDGGGRSGNGLTVSRGSNLSGLYIRGFGGVPLKVISGSGTTNKLSCVVSSKV